MLTETQLRLFPHLMVGTPKQSPPPAPPHYLLSTASLSFIFFTQHLSVVLSHLWDAVVFCLNTLTSDPPNAPPTGYCCRVGYLGVCVTPLPQVSA